MLNSATRSGDFILVKIFDRIVAQMYHLFLGYFEKHISLILTVVATFGQFLKSFGLLFIQQLVTLKLNTAADFHAFLLILHQSDLSRNRTGSSPHLNFEIFFCVAG